MSEALRRPVISLGATTRSAKPSTRREVTWSTPRRTIHLFNIDAKLVPIKESLELRIEEPPSAEQRGDGNHRQPFIGLRLRARQPRQGLRAGGVDPLPPLPIPQAPELDIQSLRLGLRLGLRLAQLQIITALAQPIFGALQFRARFWVSIADNARAKTRRPPRHRRGSTVSPTFVCDAAEAAPFFRSWELQCFPLHHAVWLPYGRASVGRRMLSFVRARGRLPRFRAVSPSPLASVQQALCLASLQRFSCASTGTVGTVGTCRYLRYLQLRKISSVTSLWPRSPLGRCSDA